jgi:membrane-bound metal-dependent hydrolase YbcI (DUF457 family)
VLARCSLPSIFSASPLHEEPSSLRFLTMPFTPFHFGLGAAIKAFYPASFSFLIFAGSQVLMDIEPGIRIYLGTEVLHGHTHTLLGALAIGVVAVVIGKPISERVIRLFLGKRSELSWRAASTGAFVGTFSHLVLDAIMHQDMRPLQPFSDANLLLNSVPLGLLHLLLLIGGLLGGLIAGYRASRSAEAKPGYVANRQKNPNTQGLDDPGEQ